MHRSARSLSPLALWFLVAAACGGKGNDGSGFNVADAGGGGGDDGGGGSGSGGDGGHSFLGDGGGSTLLISPSNATVFINTATNPPTPAKQAFKATYMGTDVTSQLMLSLQNTAVGKFMGQTFVSGTTIPGKALGVTTEVTGTSGTHGGVANLTVVALNTTGPDKDFYFIVPYQQAPSPSSNVLEFGTNLQQVDVAILLDTTGSMGSSVSVIQQDLTGTGGILAGLQAAIPDVGLAIVDHKDFPCCGFSSAPDFPVKVWQVVTTSAALAQTAVGNYAAKGGGDDPESQIPAMDYLLTGTALTWTGGGTVPTHTPAPGTAGGVDFRAGSFRVVVQITDAPWHNYDGTPADGLSTPYTFSTPDYNQLVSDFTKMDAKYVGVVDDHAQDTHPHAESQALSDATGSNVPAKDFPGGVCGAQAGTAPNGNCRLNFDINNGVGLNTSIVQAIQAISAGAAYDVTAIPANDPSNAHGVDATKFIKELRAMGEGSKTEGCPPWMVTKSKPTLTYDDVFVNVTAGTKVCFEVIPAENTIVKPTTAAQFFKAFINVVGLPSDTRLDQRSVLFLVPPAALGGAQ